jgi:hypothetical protein
MSKNKQNWQIARTTNAMRQSKCQSIFVSLCDSFTTNQTLHKTVMQGSTNINLPEGRLAARLERKPPFSIDIERALSSFCCPLLISQPLRGLLFGATTLTVFNACINSTNLPGTDEPSASVSYLFDIAPTSGDWHAALAIHGAK